MMQPMPPMLSPPLLIQEYTDVPDKAAAIKQDENELYQFLFEKKEQDTPLLSAQAQSQSQGHPSLFANQAAIKPIEPGTFSKYADYASF